MKWMILLIIFGVPLGTLIVQEIRLQQRERLPICTAQACLVDMEADNGGLGGLYCSMRFETASELLQFRVSLSTASRFCVGDEGLLSWQGDRMERFLVTEKVEE